MRPFPHDDAGPMSESKTATKKTPLSEKIKWALYFTVTVLVLIFVFANWNDVNTNFLIKSVTMPHSLSLLGTLAIGFVLGMMFGKRLLGLKKR